MWGLINYNGHLAISAGWWPYFEKPIESRSVWVHPSEKWSTYYESFIHIEFSGGQTFLVYDHFGVCKPLYTNGWSHVLEERAVPKPRDTKKYTHVWSSSGKWIKVLK